MTREETRLRARVDRAASTVGSVWPLHSFVTANPLSGFEDRPFHRAVDEAGGLFGGRGYPDPAVFRSAWEAGRIDEAALTAELAAHDVDASPASLLAEMESSDAGGSVRDGTDPATEAVDRVLSKWLAAFLDHGAAKWPMPDRERGFYAAWRGVAPYDDEIPGCETPADVPETPVAAIERALSDRPQGEWESVFERQFAALPGWTGFLKRRASDDADPWQSAYPISLLGYLAVRLALAELFDAPLEPADPPAEPPADGTPPLPELWLNAWERSHRDRLLERLSPSDVERTPAVSEDPRPDAQLVFCIDTRSEVIRRHVEAAGAYETRGYAGSFGVPMRHEGYDAEVAVDACPPVLDARHRIADRPTGDANGDRERHDRWRRVLDAGSRLVGSLTSNVATAFSFVEHAGAGYGAALAARTLLPGRVYDLLHDGDRTPEPHEFCAPAVEADRDTDHDLPTGLSLDERVEYARTVFELTGWKEFARLAVFVGHGSETTNNPFDAGLDCGACAGNAGGPNARVLAAVCNDEAVRAELRDRGVDVPADTVFLAAEHNTTTDETTLFDGDVPASHREDVAQLRADLARAQSTAAAERAESLPGRTDADGVSEVRRRAADWAETRPEWGLAGNASFVVGPRELTEGASLDGRAFLPSYDWRTDPEGDALEAVMTGPLVVAQWINSQYYFATVDNAVYGSGSKVTQNPVGNVGVFQGNGGDLMTGLPLQSLYADADRPHHQPLRLTAVIHAPLDRVVDVLRREDELARLLDNGWLRLTVIDPERDDARLHHQGEFEFEPEGAESTSVASARSEDRGASRPASDE